MDIQESSAKLIGMNAGRHRVLMGRLVLMVSRIIIVRVLKDLPVSVNICLCSMSNAYIGTHFSC